MIVLISQNRNKTKTALQYLISLILCLSFVLVSSPINPKRVQTVTATQASYCHLCGGSVAENGTSSIKQAEPDTLGLLCVNSGQSQALTLYEREEDGSRKTSYGFAKICAGQNGGQGSSFSGYITMDYARFDGSVSWGNHTQLDEAQLTQLYCPSCQEKLRKAHADVVLFDYTDYSLTDLLESRQVSILNYSVDMTHKTNVTELSVQYSE